MAASPRSRERWRRLVDELEAGDETPPSFAARHALNLATLRWWRSRFRREERAEIDFFEVALVEEAPAPDLFVELGDSGLRVRVASGFDAGEVRRLVLALC